MGFGGKMTIRHMVGHPRCVFVPPSNNPAPHPPYKRRMPNVTTYVFLLIHQPEDGHKRRNM